MSDWSGLFLSHIERRFGDGARRKAALDLKVSPSMVTYWCQGSVPREKMRKRIERWSKGDVPASVVDAPSSQTLPPTGSD